MVAGYIVGGPVGAIVGASAGGFGNAVLSQDGVHPGASGYVGILAATLESGGKLSTRNAVGVALTIGVQQAPGDPIARAVVAAGIGGAAAGGLKGGIAGSAGATTTILIEILIYGATPITDGGEP